MSPDRWRQRAKCIAPPMPIAAGLGEVMRMTETMTAHAHHRAPLAWPSGDAPQARKRMANDYMRDGLNQLDRLELIPFFCECDSPACFAVVWLNKVAFDRLREQRSMGILAGQHVARAAGAGRP